MRTKQGKITKSEVIKFRVNSVTKTQIQKLAASSNKLLSDYMRQLVEDSIAKNEKQQS